MAVEEFFDSDVYLRNDTVIPIRSRLIRDMLGGVTGARILDVGCGDGSMSAQFLDRPNKVTMVDFSEQMLNRARQNANPTAAGASVEFVRSDVLAFEPDALYDVVLCIGLLAHVPDADAVIRNVERWTAPGGRCVFQFSDDDQVGNRLLYRYYAWRRWPSYPLTRTSGQRVLTLVRSAGLRPVATRRYGFVLPGAGRLLRRSNIVRLQHLVARTPRVGLQTLLLCEKS
jgi:2-polyprenyl-3-methyl-5-hydroxy-6-metoxy-1,4-benzoquinol methylase